TINVKVQANRPYIRVEGGDVLSGVSFDNIGQGGVDGEADIDQLQARCLAYIEQGDNKDHITQAGIKTNGYGFSSDGTPSSLGSSSSQYGVFASGLVYNGGGINA